MQDTGCEMWDASCDYGMQGLGCRTQAAGWVREEGCMMWDAEQRLQSAGCEVQAVGESMQDVG